MDVVNSRIRGENAYGWKRHILKISAGYFASVQKILKGAKKYL